MYHPGGSTEGLVGRASVSVPALVGAVPLTAAAPLALTTASHTSRESARGGGRVRGVCGVGTGGGVAARAVYARARSVHAQRGSPLRPPLTERHGVGGGADAHQVCARDWAGLAVLGEGDGDVEAHRDASRRRGELGLGSLAEVGGGVVLHSAVVGDVATADLDAAVGEEDGGAMVEAGARVLCQRGLGAPGLAVGVVDGGLEAVVVGVGAVLGALVAARRGGGGVGWGGGAVSGVGRSQGGHAIAGRGLYPTPAAAAPAAEQLPAREPLTWCRPCRS